MTTVKVNDIDRSAAYSPAELEQIRLRFVASDGEVGQGSAPIPDPAGTQNPYTGESFQVLSDGETIIDGFVGPLTRERGESGAGARLLDIYAIGDENAVLHGFRAYKWKRPAESTRARFLAMLDDFVPWVTDTTWVTTEIVEPMPAKTYTTETLFDDLFQEILDLTGCTAFVENHRAHLHPAPRGITGGLAFSDAAFDYSTTFPLYDPRRSKDGMELRDDVMVAVPKGVAVRKDDAAIARYGAGGLKHQALIVLGEGTLGEAAAKARTILASSKAERITYEFDAGPFTAEQLASIPPGCLVPVTSAVFGLTASTQRIAGMTVTYLHPDKFMAHIELGYPIRKRVKPPRLAMPELVNDIYTGDLAIEEGEFYDGFAWGDPDGGPLPYGQPGVGNWFGMSPSGHQWNGGGGETNPGDATLTGSPPGGGAGANVDTGNVAAFEDLEFRLTVDFHVTENEDSDDPTLEGWGFIVRLVKIITSGPLRVTSPDGNELQAEVEHDGTVRLRYSGTEVAVGNVGGEITGGTLVWEVSKSHNRSTLSFGATTLLYTGSHAGIAAYERSVQLTQAGGGDFDDGAITHVTNIVQDNLGTVSDPATGQVVQNEATGTGDGSTTQFTTAFPYRPGSLRVLVNGIDVTASLTSQNSLTGDFSLGFVAAAGSEIVTTYVAV